MSRLHIFEIADVLAAFKAAESEGRPLSTVMHIDWNSARPYNSVKYISVYFTILDGRRDRVLFRFKGEKHIGQIIPFDDEDVNKYNASLSNERQPIKKRSKVPCLQFNKWNTVVPTMEDGFTLKTKEDGTLDVPSDDHLSAVYELVSYMDKAFYDNVYEMIKSGKITKPNSRNLASGVKGAILVTNDTIRSMTQERTSIENVKNPNKPLANPITRIHIKFNADGLPMRAKFYDKSTEYIENGRKKYDLLVDEDGTPLNIHNVHKLILSRSVHDGVISADVCISSMGISFPLDIQIDVVERPVTTSLSIDDVYAYDDTLSADTKPQYNGELPYEYDSDMIYKQPTIRAPITQQPSSFVPITRPPAATHMPARVSRPQVRVPCTELVSEVCYEQLLEDLKL